MSRPPRPFLSRPAPLRRLGGTLLVAILLSGCAAQRLYEDGMRRIAAGDTYGGLEQIRRASEMDPTNGGLRLSLITERQRAAMQRMALAEQFLAAERFDDAAAAYREALGVDPGNERANEGLQRTEDARAATALLAQARLLMNQGDLDGAQAKVTEALRRLPTSTAAATLSRDLGRRVIARDRDLAAQRESASPLRRPVSLQLRDANLRMVFEALSRSTGVNIVVDRDVRSDLKASVFVSNATLADAIDLILLQNQLARRMVTPDTILIYPSTAAKQREYRELNVRTFQLSNADVKHVVNVLRSLLRLQNIVADERTGTIVLRETPETLAVAERVIAAQEMAEPEVMLEVEVLEVSRERLSTLGVQWPSTFSLSTPTTAEGGGALTLGALRDISSGQLIATPLGLGVNLRLVDTTANLLASPRIRARNREKARVLIGDRVPVIVNTVTPLQAGSSVVTGNVQYLDVGIKLEVEPQVFADSDVGIRLNLEVSNIVREISGPQGSLAYQIGTRNAQTALRLRDGETQVLAGLINDTDRNSAAKVPGLGQLPILGRLFSNNTGNAAKSEIVLSITPRVIRSLQDVDSAVRDIGSGTEADVRPTRFDATAPGRNAVPVPVVPAPLPSAPGASAPRAVPAPPPPTNAVPANGGAAPTTSVPAPAGTSSTNAVPARESPPAIGGDAMPIPAAPGGTTVVPMVPAEPDAAAPATAPVVPGVAVPSSPSSPVVPTPGLPVTPLTPVLPGPASSRPAPVTVQPAVPLITVPPAGTAPGAAPGGARGGDMLVPTPTRRGNRQAEDLSPAPNPE